MYIWVKTAGCTPAKKENEKTLHGSRTVFSQAN